MRAVHLRSRSVCANPRLGQTCGLIVIIVLIAVRTAGGSIIYFEANPMDCSNGGCISCTPTSNGAGAFSLDTSTGIVSYYVRLNSLSTAETSSHIHGPAPSCSTAGILFALPTGTVKTGTYGPVNVSEMLNQQHYIDVHTQGSPSGEIFHKIIPIPGSVFGCCLPSFGSGTICINTTPSTCQAMGGTVSGSQCTPSPQSCCLPGGGCIVVDSFCCSSQGGTVVSGSSCTSSTCACSAISKTRTAPVGSGMLLCNVRVTNIVDFIQSATSASFHVQDFSGPDGRSGITIFGSNALISAALAGVSVGDQIDIQGITGSFNGQLELVDGATPLKRLGYDGPAGLIVPQPITTSELLDGSTVAEARESELVKLKCVSFPAANGTAQFAASTSYTATDGVNNVTVRIASSNVNLVGTIIPSGRVNVTGIVVQFDSAAPFDAGYQLTPRSTADIEVATNCTCATGDLNLDAVVDGQDIRRFTELLAGFPGSDIEICAADCNTPRDCIVDSLDVPPFISLLLQGGSLSSVTPISCCVESFCLPNADSFATLTTPGTSDETAIQFGTSDMPFIPAGFFYNGSSQFSGRVVMAGVPVNESNLGRTDTRVQRGNALNFPGLGFPRNSDPVPVEIIELSLCSIQSITVTGSSPPQDWILAMNLAPTQQQGNLSATLDSALGGSFTATVPVRPFLVFARKSDCLSAINGGVFNPNVAVRKFSWDDTVFPPVMMSLSSAMQFSTVAPAGGEFYCAGELNNPFPFFPGIAPGGGGGGGGGGGFGDEKNSVRFAGPACPPHVPPGTMNNHFTCPPPPPPPGRCGFKLERVVPISPCVACGICAPPTLKISLQCPAATGTVPPCVPIAVPECPQVIVVLIRCPGSPNDFCVAIYSAAGCCSG